MVKIPDDAEAEAAVLGACMVNRAWRERALAVLTADDFHTPIHAAIFTAIAGLHREGEPADLTSLTLKIGSEVSKERLLFVHTAAPLSIKVPLEIVADTAARRRVIHLGERLIEGAADPDVEIGVTLSNLQQNTEDVRLPVDAFTSARDASTLLEGDDSYDWVVSKLLECGDRVMWTAGEGIGKSTWQLQLAVMAAAGVHPVSRVDTRRLRVLVVDLENSDRQLRRQLRRLMAAAGDRYQGGLKVTEPRAAGIDLRDARDFRWLDRHCEEVHPELLVIGPLYKMFRVRGAEKKTDETAAEETAYAIDRIRQRYGCAVSIEAHSPKGEHGDRDGLRPYGASLWMRWPEFGFGMKPIANEKAVELKAWRGSRDRDRDWPSTLYVGARWPWEAAA